METDDKLLVWSEEVEQARKKIIAELRAAEKTMDHQEYWVLTNLIQRYCLGVDQE